jgi:mRNA export factor
MLGRNVTQGSNPQAVQVIGKHDQPISHMKFQNEKSILMTSSWDKTVKFWDCRQPNPVHSIPFTEKIYGMDIKGDAIVFGTGDKMFHIFNLNNMGSPMAIYRSPLQYQLKCLAIMADKEGFAAGCIEGRASIEYFSDMQTKVQQTQANALPNTKLPNTKSFVFKCHRVESDIYPVNVIDFHKSNSLMTAGSDGTFSYWNFHSKQKILSYEMYKLKAPITCAKFSPIGDMMFYSLSYDWHKGYSGNSPQYPNTIIMHPIADSEMINKR